MKMVYQLTPRNVNSVPENLTWTRARVVLQLRGKIFTLLLHLVEALVMKQKSFQKFCKNFKWLYLTQLTRHLIVHGFKITKKIRI